MLRSCPTHRIKTLKKEPGIAAGPNGTVITYALKPEAKRFERCPV
jgi:hypothetical protein